MVTSPEKTFENASSTTVHGPGLFVSLQGYLTEKQEEEPGSGSHVLDKAMADLDVSAEQEVL